MQVFPWCKTKQPLTENIYTRLKILSRSNETSQLTGQIVDMYEIFKQQEECENPKVVLIEGSPGMGKTTFCLKLSLDWSKGKTKEPFPSFQLLLLLKCRDMKTANIRDAIVEQLLPQEATDAEKEAFFQSIRENQPNVLLIFDGLDELDENVAPKNLVDPRKRSFLSRSYVIATSRHEAGLKVREFCDTTLEVVGFAPEDAQDYMAKFFSGKEEMAENLMKKIKEHDLEELITNPLNTALLCAVFEENGDLPSTRSKLYEKIILYILKRYFVKLEQKLPKQPLYGCQKELTTLGKLALHGIVEDNLSFDESDLDSELGSSERSIAEMGFLSVEESTSTLDPKRLFSFLHKTFQEYFAAYYLSEQLVNAVVECKDFFREYSVEGRKFSQLFVFIAGFLAGKGASARLVSFMASLSCSLSTLYPTTTADEDLEQYEQQLYDVQLSFILLCDCVAECSDGQQLNEVQLQMCAAIAENICWKKLELVRRFNGESSVVYKVLCEVLKYNTTVEELYLPENEITDCSSLAEALQLNNTVKSLYLSENEITDCSSLAEALKRNNTVEWLDLSFNKITDCSSLAEALKRNNTVETLDLTNNRITDCSSLAEALKRNNTVKTLYLINNQITDCSSLAEALKRNNTVETLWLWANPISDKTPLQDLQRHNKHLTLDYDG